MVEKNFRFWETTLDSLAGLSYADAGEIVLNVAREVFSGERPAEAKEYDGFKLALYKNVLGNARESSRMSQMGAENGRKGGRPPKEKGVKTPPLTKGKEGKGNEPSFPFGKEGGAAAPSGATPPVPPPPAP